MRKNSIYTYRFFIHSNYFHLVQLFHFDFRFILKELILKLVYESRIFFKWRKNKTIRHSRKLLSSSSFYFLLNHFSFPNKYGHTKVLFHWYSNHSYVFIGLRKISRLFLNRKNATATVSHGTTTRTLFTEQKNQR